MGKFWRNLFVGGALAGAGFLFFTKKGKAIQKEMKEKLPQLTAEVRMRYEKGRRALDDVVDEVVEEWRTAKRLMEETAAPLKAEIKRRMRKGDDEL